MTRLPVRLLTVVAVLAVGTAVGQGLTTAQPAVLSPRQVPVVGAGAVCPDLRSAAGVSSNVAVGLAGAVDPAAVAGTAVSAGALGGAAPAALPVPGGGAVAAGLGSDVSDGALSVRAAGPGAAGLAAVLTTQASAGAVRGLASVPCAAPSTDVWLVGGGTVAGESSTLVVANLDAQPAVVDVTVVGAEGPADDRPGRGVGVPARGRVAVPLDTLAPDRSVLALHVHAVRGRVAAAVRHERSDGVVPHGVAYAAPSAPPAGVVQVPALPAGPGYRAVEVANPGDADVQMQVSITTAQGQFVPEGMSSVPVRAGTTVRVDLSAALAATPAAVQVTATGGPVLAAGFVEEVGAGDVRDLTYVAPAAALAAPALLPDVTLGAAEQTLLLSAPTGDAVVEIDVVHVAGGPAVAAPPRRIDVPGGRTVAVTVASLLPTGTTGRVGVVVRPDRRASRVLADLVVLAAPADGPLLTSLSPVPAAQEAAQPVVVRDPAVGAGTS